MDSRSLVFGKLVGLAAANLAEGRTVVVGALVGIITEANLCQTEDEAVVLAVSVWKKASQKGA